MKVKIITLQTLMLFVCCLSQTGLLANNVQITNMVVSGPGAIQFNISWENSWFIPGYNYDAVWVFIKSQDCSNTQQWTHVDVSNSSANHAVSGGTGLIVEAVSDGKGVFIRRNSTGGGTQSGTVMLSFAAPIPAFATVNFQVFGIEMVWVPQGDYRAGDGSTNHTTQSAGSWGSGNSTPRLVSSEAAVGMDFFRNDKSGDNAVTAHNPIPAAFPKGWAGFYCMKYEISQQQYVAFLNSLMLLQQSNRTAILPTSAAGTPALTTSGSLNRNAIVVQTPSSAGVPTVYNTDLNGDGTYGDGDNIACNYLTWADLLAYLDWTALSPMTELEFEKAVRGPEFTVLNENASGNTASLQAISNALTGAGTNMESSTAAGIGNFAFGAGASTTLGPLRTGFAATGSTVRSSSSATYWGIMDMSGNVWEQCVSIGYWNGGTRVAGGHVFTGLNGDGNIAIMGDNDVSNWPGNTILGNVIVRGGNWQYSAQRAQTSDRFYVNSIAENSIRTARTGGRGVRRP